METKKILMVLGLVLLLFFIMRNIRVKPTTTTTTTTTTKVVYRKPVTPVAGPNPHYNAYKAQYYN